MGSFSIKKKTISIILAVVLFSIVTTVVVLGLQNINRLRRSMANKINTASQVIGRNCSIPISFDLNDKALEVLSGFDAIPEVMGAVIYTPDGNVFASHKKDNPQLEFKYDPVHLNSIQFRGQRLYVSGKIEDKGDMIGSILVVASTRNLSRQIYDYIWFSVVLLVLVFTISGFLGAWLSRRLVRPVLKLADTAAAISNETDYSIRIEKMGSDEIGTLYDSFNEMLNQIEARDHEILQLNEGLEDKVEERTRDLLKAKEQAEKARRRAELADQAKSTFLANMSHEIRTPMNAILGYSSLLMKLIEDKKQREFLEIVQTSGRNLLALINDILDLSKIESGKLNIQYKPMNPHHLLDEIRNIFRIRTEEKGIHFRVEIAPDIPTGLLMDETRLRQILFNVVGNAVKFTHEGHVKLSVSKKHAEKQTSCIDLIFTVEDTGIGVPEEQIETIFKAFEQQAGQSSQYGGTGLGLAITRRLVEMMNGKILLDSRVNQGSTFTIQFKGVEISVLKADVSEPQLISTEGLRFESSKVLLVEDNYYNLQLVRKMMEDKNLQVVEAENGEEALLKLEGFTPDLILMDMKMPVMDGYAATRQIKGDERFMHIPVIALTADVMKDGLDKIKEIGCETHLSKPVDEIQLFLVLIKYLPYQKQEEIEGEFPAEPIKKETGIDIDSINGYTAEELENVLDSQLMPQWEAIGDSLLLDDWMKFARHVKEVGEGYEAAFLVEYGNHIIENVENLNIMELKKTIKRFKDIVSAVKKRSDR